MHNIFSGSYSSDDVQILLKPVVIDFVNINDKEKYIQSEQRHYSEMLSKEELPSAQYMQLFYDSIKQNKKKFAQDIIKLAYIIQKNKTKRNVKEITLVSLARAGTPIGVLLKRTLSLLGEDTSHYSISIIRDREIDEVALQYIIKQQGHVPESIFFIDGWTGKGVIGKELKKFIKNISFDEGKYIYDELYVLADLCGQANYYATTDDYLLPSSVLNAIISGLVSRSVLNSDVVEKDDFHACVFYAQWQNKDVSMWFANEIFSTIKDILLAIHSKYDLSTSISQKVKQEHKVLFKKRQDFLYCCLERHSITDVNLIKPGIAEASRVLLRRVPELLYIREKNNPATLHLEILAHEKSITVRIDSELPYYALAIIKSFR